MMISEFKYLCVIFGYLAIIGVSHLTFANSFHVGDVKLTEEHYQRLEQGEILIFEERYELDDGRKEVWMQASMLVNAHPEDCWRVLNDLAHYYEFQPRLRESKIVERQDSSTIVRLSLKAAWKNIFYHLKYTREDERMVLHYTLHPDLPHNIGDTKGWWQAIPYNNITIINYVSHVDTGMWIPGFIERIFIKKELPKVVSYIKRRIESGGTWNQWKEK